MKSIDEDVKLSFMQIVLSPILALWSMANNGEDITEEIELNPNSQDSTEAYLANNQEGIDERVERYSTRGKAKKQTRIEGIEVNAEALEKIEQKRQPVNERKNSKEHEIAD